MEKHLPGAYTHAFLETHREFRGDFNAIAILKGAPPAMEEIMTNTLHGLLALRGARKARGQIAFC